MSGSSTTPGRPVPALPGLAAALLAGLLAAGCTSGPDRGVAAAGSSDGPSGSAAGADAPQAWRNGIFRSTCDGLARRPFDVTLKSGAGEVPAAVAGTPGYDFFAMTMEGEATGDLDGDGVPDVVVLLRCRPEPSNGFVEEVQVFSPAHGRLGSLPSPSTLPEAVVLAPLYDPSQLAVQGGVLVAGMKVYGPQDSHASGPSQQITVRWRWDGHTFVRVS